MGGGRRTRTGGLQGRSQGGGQGPESRSASASPATSWSLLSLDSPPFCVLVGGRSRARSIVERRGEARGSRGWVLAPGRLLLAAAASGGPCSRDAADARGWRAAQRLRGHVPWPRQPATMSLTARVSCSMLSCFVSVRPVLPRPGVRVEGRSKHAVPTAMPKDPRTTPTNP